MADDAVPPTIPSRPPDDPPQIAFLFEGTEHLLGCFEQGRKRANCYRIVTREYKLVEEFPSTDKGWTDAWTRFSQLEPFAKPHLSGARQELTGIASALRQCLLVGGHNNSLIVGTKYALAFREDEIAVIPEGQTNTAMEVLYKDVRDIELSGGSATSGGGFFGGGFGAKPAMEGMLVASALNALTTRTKAWTFVWIRPLGSELIFLETTHTPEDLRILLSPVFGMIESSRSDQPNQRVGERGADPTERLIKLAELRREGLLSEEEFAKAKAQLLD